MESDNDHACVAVCHQDCRKAAGEEKMEKSSSKDRGWSWMVLVASFSLQAITVGVCLSSGIFVIEFMEMFGTNQAETAWAASMQLGVAFLIGAPLSGYISQKSSHRVSIITGGLVLFTGLLSSAFASGLVHLYLTCGLLSGIGVGLIYSPSIGIIGHYFEKQLAMALGITIGGGGCGAMIFPQVFYYLIVYFSWRGALVTTSALALNCCMLGALMFPQKVCEEMPKNSPGLGSLQEIAHEKESCLKDFALLKNAHFMLFFFNCFLVCFGCTAVFILLVDYAIDCGISPHSASILLSVTGLLSTVGRFVMALLMHFTQVIGVVNLYNFFTVICGLVVLLMPAANGFVSLVVLCSVFGFCYGCNCSSSPVVATQFFGAERLTTVYSYTLIAGGFGCLLGPPTAGWLYERTRNYHLSNIFNGATIVLSVVVLVPLYILSCFKRRRLRVASVLIVSNDSTSYKQVQ